MEPAEVVRLCSDCCFLKGWVNEALREGFLISMECEDKLLPALTGVCGDMCAREVTAMPGRGDPVKDV